MSASQNNSTQAIIDLDFYIPVKDGESFIRECVESVLRQTFKPKRIVVYYNIFSKDRTLEILKSLPVEIREVDFPLSDARNLATRELTTEWIGLCDADVILHKDFLKELWNKRNSGATIIGGNLRERVRTVGDLFRSISSPCNWGRVDVHNPYMFTPNMIVKRQRILDVGSYQTSWVNYEDSDLCLRLKEQGDHFYYVANAYADHWRSDEFFSALDLRWRYSFQRQSALYNSPEGVFQKIQNNIALAGLVFGKSLEVKNSQLFELVMILPLHHFALDIDHLKKAGSGSWFQGAEDERSDRGIVESLKNFLEYNFMEKGWENYWSAFSTHSSIASKFASEYLYFLECAYQVLLEKGLISTDFRLGLSDFATLESRRIWAVSEARWAAMVESCAVRARTISSIDFQQLQTVMANESSQLEKLPAEGLLVYRQPAFPSFDRVWTCRDLTEWLAMRGKRLVWTETFQGSTAIAFVDQQSVQENLFRSSGYLESSRSG